MRRAPLSKKTLRVHLWRSKPRAEKQEEHIVIGKKKGRPLVISETHSEDHLTARYLYYSLPLFACAAAAVGGAIYLFVNYLKGL